MAVGMVQTVGDELGRIPMSPALQASLMRARDYASQQSHTQVTLEHLLLALTEDEDAALVLQSSQIDLQRLRNDVAGHIGSQNDRLPGGVASDPGISAGLTQILKYATLAAKQGRRPRIDGAIVLAAIVGDGRSMAAAFLKAQGLTFEEAIRVLQQVAGPPGRRPTAAPPNANPAPVDAVADAARYAPPATPDQPNGPATAVARTARNLVDTEDLLAAARARVMSRGVLPRLEDAGAAPPEDVAGSGSLGAEYADPHEPIPPPEPPAPPPLPAVDPPRQLQNGHAPDAASPISDAEPASATAARAGAQPPPLPWAPPPLPSMPRPPQGSATGQHRSPLPAAPPPSPQPPDDPRHLAPLADEPPPMRHRPSGTGRPPPYPPGPPPGYGAPPGPPPHLHRPPEMPPGAPPRPPGPDGGLRGDPVRVIGLDADQVTHSIPARLRAGVTHSVEVRVGRSAMVDGPPGAPRAPGRGEMPFARAVSVRLRSAKGAPVIVPISPETQWDKATAAGRLAGEGAVWRFLVMPSKAGRSELTLQVAAHVMATDGHLAERTLPEQVIAIKVVSNVSRSLRRAALFLLTGLASIAAMKIAEEMLAFDIVDLLRRLVGL